MPPCSDFPNSLRCVDQRYGYSSINKHQFDASFRRVEKDYVMRVAGIGKLSWLVVLMLSMAIVAACGAETRTSCSFCGQSDMPNVMIGYEDLRESAKDTLDVDIRVESGEGHVIDLNDEKFHFWNACRSEERRVGKGGRLGWRI